jgi:hypothetical protein
MNHRGDWPQTKKKSLFKIRATSAAQMRPWIAPRDWPKRKNRASLFSCILARRKCCPG